MAGNRLGNIVTTASDKYAMSFGFTEEDAKNLQTPVGQFCPLRILIKTFTISDRSILMIKG